MLSIELVSPVQFSLTFWSKHLCIVLRFVDVFLHILSTCAHSKPKAQPLISLAVFQKTFKHQLTALIVHILAAQKFSIIINYSKNCKCSIRSFLIYFHSLCLIEICLSFLIFSVKATTKILWQCGKYEVFLSRITKLVTFRIFNKC